MAEPIYEIKPESEGLVGDRIILKKETITQENVQELSLNNLEEQLNSAKQQILDGQARVKEIEAEIIKVKEVLNIK